MYTLEYKDILKIKQNDMSMHVIFISNGYTRKMYNIKDIEGYTIGETSITLKISDGFMHTYFTIYQEDYHIDYVILKMSK